MTGRLRLNPDPIKVVPQAVRDVWTERPEHRCYYEDGRGRCRRYDTQVVRVEGSAQGVEWYCQTHYPVDWKPDMEASPP